MSREGFPTSERIYATVKQELLDGPYRPGERIDAALLAERHATSITPIRSALHRLVGERLVESRPAEGFFRRSLTEASLRDLYAWNGHVLSLAVRLRPQDRVGQAAPVDGADLARNAADLFLRVAEQSRNEHCFSAIVGLNDQLHAVRRIEPEVIFGIADELEGIAANLSQRQPGELRRAIARYHLRRVRAAPELVRLAHQDGRS